MANRIDLSNILINFLKKARYERHIEEGTLEENQFYAVTDGNEKTEYGDLFGNIENQADLYNALYSSRIFKKDMCNDPRGYAIAKALRESAKYFDLSKFTVVGNPTISDDGVASGFSTRDYLTVNFNITLPFEIKYRFKQSYNATENTATFISLSAWQNAIVSQRDRHTVWITTTNPNFTASYAEKVLNIYELSENTWYNGYLKWDGTMYTFGVEGVDSQTFDSPYPIKLNSNNLLCFGAYRSLTNGSIDLSKFSITVDEQPVFYGYSEHTGTDTYPRYNIEIPYYKSKDGVKIVDVAYKPLVDQLYTETGMGNYIIIDETNKTFRLPLPDIYSQIENKTSFTLRKWED